MPPVGSAEVRSQRKLSLSPTVVLTAVVPAKVSEWVPIVKTIDLGFNPGRFEKEA